MANIFQQRYYKINKFLLSAFGQWPYQSGSLRFTLVVIFTCIAMSHIIPQIIAVVEFHDDSDVVLEALPPFVMDVACVIKLITISGNIDKMLKICEHIKVDWITVAQQPEITILQEYAETGRRFTMIYAGIVWSATSIYVIQPATPQILDVIRHTNNSESPKYPMPIYYYNIDTDTYYFYFLVHTFIVINVILTVFAAADAFFIVQVQHSCGMFAVVGHQMQRVADEISEDWEPHTQLTHDPTLQHLAICIRSHKRVIAYSELLQSCYRWPFLLTVGLNMVVMSISGFQAVLIMDERPGEAIRHSVFIGGQLIHLFLQCFFSQRMIDHSHQVQDLLYQSEWYRVTLRTQKLMRLVLMRTQEACQLEAGKFLVMSLENFTSVVKTSMSYFTLLRSMQ